MNRMKTQFSEILSEIISHSEFSKNEMIRNCDIDRSSFFKFLNGTRTPTQEQLNTICKKLLLTPDEERDLREAYSYATKGNKQISISNRIIEILWTLETGSDRGKNAAGISACEASEPAFEVISGSGQVLEYLKSAVLYEAAKAGDEHEIDAFLPNSAEPFWIWLMDYIREEPESRLKVRSLTALPSRIYNTDSILYKFRYPLLCSLLYPDTFIGYYYYANTAGEPDPGVLYAHSLILDSRTILLNANMDKAIVIPDAESCGDDRKRFLNNLNSAHLFALKMTNKEIGREVAGGIKHCYGGCSLDCQLWDRNTIKYFSERVLENYMNAASTAADEREKRAFLSRKRAFTKNVLDCIGTKTFLIDERYLPSAKSWAAALTSKEELLVYSESSRYHLVIDEMHTVHAFSSFFEGLSTGGYVINSKLAKELVNGLTGSNRILSE